jgi:hypothetical protein
MLDDIKVSSMSNTINPFIFIYIILFNI